jgi:hypothetical protein
MMNTPKWGRKETIIFPPYSPIYTYGAVFFALILTGIFVYLRFSKGQTPLQQFYTPIYARSAVGGAFNKRDKYQLLYVGDGARAARLATEEDVQAGTTAAPNGKPITLALSTQTAAQGIHVLYRGPEQTFVDGPLHAYLRGAVFGGDQFRDIYKLPLLFGFLSLLAQLPFSIRKDIRRRKELKYGRRLQRMTPAQDPDQPLGKILRLTLDGKPAPGNPMAGKTGAASVPVIDPPKDTEAAKTAPVVKTYTFPGPNLTPAETWSSGHRTPYGLAFAPDGRLWEVEHGPWGGDELNLIEPTKNYGWPLVSYAKNYDGVPIASPDTRSDLTKPVIYWTPIIAPGNLIFYNGAMFPQWKGSALISGLASQALFRITFDGKGGAQPAERWVVDHRIRDVEVAPDGALWMIEDAKPGGLFRVTPKEAKPSSAQ